MKLTMEPTGEGIQAGYPTITISVPSDDLSIVDMVELLRDMLLAMSYHPENIKDMLNV